MSYECTLCGEEYDTQRAKNIHVGKSHDKDGKPWMSKKKFRRLWIDEDLTYEEMAERWDCARGTITRWGKRHDLTKPWDDPNELRRLYNDEDMSQREMADHLDCHHQTIVNKFKEYDIDADHPHDPTRPVYHGFYRKHDDVVGSEYEVISTSIGGKQTRVRLHRLVALAHDIITFEEFLDPNVLIHHESNHGLDNRPSNLKKMGRSEHMTHHWEQRKG